METDPQEQEQIENPPVTPTEPQIPAWQAAVFEANQRANRAEQIAAQLQHQQSAPPIPPVTPLEPGDVFQNPELFRNRINQDMANTVAPINNFMQEMQRERNYNRLKSSIKAQNPGQAASLAQIEHLIDNEFLHNNTTLSIDPMTFANVVRTIVGGLYLQGAFNQPNQPNQSTPPVIPPNTRPSAPLPRTTSAPKFDESSLSENERRLMREQGMTVEEFITMRDTPPNEVTTVWKAILQKRKGAK